MNENYSPARLGDAKSISIHQNYTINSCYFIGEVYGRIFIFTNVASRNVSSIQLIFSNNQNLTGWFHLNFLGLGLRI